MSNFNIVTLSGHLGKKPEIRTTQNGSKVATFSIATTDRWHDKNTGERKQVTHWHRIVLANDGLAKTADMMLGRGSKVGIVGKLENRKWTDGAGVERTVTEIIVRSGSGQLILMDRAPGTTGEKEPPAEASAPQSIEEALDDNIPY